MRTRVGYAGGTKVDPTYRDLGDHAESIQVEIDPERVSFGELLDVFWRSHRPIYPDRASQYRSAILAADDAQLLAARASHECRQRDVGAMLYTQIEPLDRFYLAEDYHQKYRLGRTPTVAQELRATHPRTIDFANSEVAMRINAHLGGHLSRRQLEAEIESFGLSPAAQRELVSAAR